MKLFDFAFVVAHSKLLRDENALSFDWPSTKRIGTLTDTATDHSLLIDSPTRGGKLWINDLMFSTRSYASPFDVKVRPP